MSGLEESDLQLINDILGIENDLSDPIFVQPQKPAPKPSNLGVSKSYQPIKVQNTKEDDDFLWSSSSDSDSPKEEFASKPKTPSKFTENVSTAGNQTSPMFCHLCRWNRFTRRNDNKFI